MNKRMTFRFDDDERGNATVEFVIIFPVLMLWLAASFLFYDAFRSMAMTEKVAFTVSDMASRYEEMDNSKMSLLVAVQQKMLPRRLTNWSTRISSICFEDDLYKVMWSYAESDEGVEGNAPLTDETIPLDIMPPLAKQDSIILTEVSAWWTPLIRSSGMVERRWSNRLVTRPRFAQIMPHLDENPNTICPKNVT